jgi:hypothetical protein
VQKIFELSELVLLTASENICLPIADQPMTLLVGQECFEHANEGERFFLLARAVSAAKQGFTLLLRASPERLLLLVHALKMLENPAHTVAAIDMTALAELSRELAAALPAPKRRQLSPSLAELFAEGECNPRRLASLALELGTRVALCITGDVASACDALLRHKGDDPATLHASERSELARTDPGLRALLSFAVSEAYLEVRREALAQDRSETR